MFLTVQLGSYDNVYYEVLINGENFDNVAGKYTVTGKFVNRIYRNDENQTYQYLYVRDNFDGLNTNGTVTFGNQTEGYGWAAETDANIASDFTPMLRDSYDGKLKAVSHFKYENPVYVDSRNLSKTIWAQGTDDVEGYNISSFYHIDSWGTQRDFSPLFVKIAVPTLTVTNSLVNTYKIGQHNIDLNADMINQIVGPFSTSKTNTIVIKVKKGTPRQDVY